MIDRKRHVKAVKLMQLAVEELTKERHGHDHDYYHAACSLCQIEKQEHDEILEMIRKLEI